MTRFAVASFLFILIVAGAEAVPMLRGIAETRSGEKFEGWIRVDGETMILKELAGGERKIAASELKVAHMHLVDATPSPGSNSPAKAPSMAPGLKGSYYRAPDFGGGAPVVRVDPVIDFTWGSSPLANFPADNFSVRWEGEVETTARGNYSFHTSTDDGARLWVDGKPLIDHWTNQAEAETSGSIELEGGRRYAIRFEFFEGSSSAAARLRWSPPGGNKEIIPAARLSHLPGLASGKIFPMSKQHGLLGSYYKGTNFEEKAAERIDPGIKFDFAAQPAMPNYPNQNISIRWEGEVIGPISGKVTFQARSDDGVRLWVGGNKLIDAWREGASTDHRGEVQMEAGKRYPIRLEYYQGGGPAEVSLSWSGPSLGLQLVPAASLFARAAGAMAVRRDTGLWLKGGSFLAGSVTKADAKAVEIACLVGKPLRIPNLYLASIELYPIDPTRRAAMVGREPGCLLNNGNFLESSLLSIDQAGKVKASSILFGLKDLRPGQVHFIKLNKPNKPEANFELHTMSGSRLRADSLTLDGGQAVLKDNSRYRFKLDPADVAAVYGVATKGL